MNMKKIEKKLSKLEEQKLKKASPRLDKKIMKLEKKKEKLEKWLKIKLPFRILIKGVATWLIIGVICFACSYIPIIKEIKMAVTGVIAYIAPESVTKVLDIVTLNVGVSNNDFEWLESTLNSYINNDVELNYEERKGSSFTYDGTGYKYSIDGKEVTEAEYYQYVAEGNEKLYGAVEEIFGVTSVSEVNSMSISEMLMKVATNSTDEIVSLLLDMSNLTTESRQKVEQDINKGLELIPKLNNNQMNELVGIITKEAQKITNDAQNAANGYNAGIESELVMVEELQEM